MIEVRSDNFQPTVRERVERARCGDSEVLVWCGRSARATTYCLRHGLRPVIITEAPSPEELIEVGRIVVDRHTFAGLPRDAYTSHEVLIYVFDGYADPVEAALNARQRFVKRAIDIVGAAAALIVAAPVLALAAVAIRLETRGPALITQTRVGIDGRRIRMRKLRSMRIDAGAERHEEYFARLAAGTAEQFDGLYKLKNDSRITRVGRVLRRYSLDELPQLLDVLRGDMSLVGPRPALANELGTYDADAWLRLRTKPGCTGLWQVNGRSTTTFREMIDFDVQYWRGWSAAEDLLILARTPAALLRGETA